MAFKLIPELKGKPGSEGPGLPVYGNTGSVAVKNSSEDYDIRWTPLSAINVVKTVEPVMTTTSEFLTTLQGDILLA